MQSVVSLLKDALMQFNTEGQVRPSVVENCTPSMLYEINTQTYQQLKVWHDQLISQGQTNNDVIESIQKDVEALQAKHEQVVTKAQSELTLVTVDDRRSIHTILSQITAEIKRLKEHRQSLDSSMSSQS